MLVERAGRLRELRGKVSNGGQQTAHSDGLSHYTDYAERPRPLDQCGIVMPGEEEHGCLRTAALRANLGHHIEAVHDGHIKIRDHEIEPVLLEQLNTLDAAEGFPYGISDRLQYNSYVLTKQLVIIDDQCRFYRIYIHIDHPQMVSYIETTEGGNWRLNLGASTLSAGKPCELTPMPGGETSGLLDLC